MGMLYHRYNVEKDGAKNPRPEPKVTEKEAQPKKRTKKNKE